MWPRIKSEHDEANTPDTRPWLQGEVGPVGRVSAPVVDLKLPRAKIGELTLERDFLSGALNKAGQPTAKR